VNLNVCALIGKVVTRLKKEINNGKIIVQFYMKVNSTQNGNEDLHRIILFEETAEKALREIQKGDTVWVKGKVRSYRYRGELVQEIWGSEIDRIQIQYQ
jgi:single-stranded DNA-binding protein